MRRAAGLLALVFVACVAGAPHAAPLKYDVDKDGTIDIAEMEAAAAAAFDRLNKDSDTTLDYGETKGRLDKNAFLAADPDRDATLSKDEYIEMAKKLFKDADTDDSGTLDQQELRSRAGRALMRLLQ